MLSPELVELIKTLGAFGLVAWIVIYVFKSLLPKQTDTFKAEMVAMREFQSNENRESRAAFERTLDVIRQTFVQDTHKEFVIALSSQRESFLLEQSKSRDMFALELRKQRHGYMGLLHLKEMQLQELLIAIIPGVGDKYKKAIGDNLAAMVKDSEEATR